MKTNSREFIAGWLDSSDTSYGVDKISSTDRYEDDEAYLITQFYRVGSKLIPKTFQKVTAELTKLMVADDSVKIAYRTVQGGSWTDIKTWDTDDDQSLWSDFGAREIKNIQFKITLNNKVELIEATIL